MTMNIRGPGGRFIGGAGGGSLGIGEKFSIDIDIMSVFDSTGIDQATAAMKEINTIGQDSAKTNTVLASSAKETADSIREQISPIRSVSWDLLLMGRSMSILNTTFLGSNQLIRTATGLIYGFGAVIRFYVGIKDIERVLIEKGIINSAKQVAVNQTEIATYTALAGAATAAATAKGAAAAAGLVAAPFTGGLSMLGGVIGAFQQGGTIPATGPYLLHKGETVIPSGTSMNIININMTTGGISSSVDVDRMLDVMALRMAQESRRRLGGGI